MFLKIVGVIAIYELLKSKENIEDMVKAAKSMLEKDKNK